jgi:hypothetical protein
MLDLIFRSDAENNTDSAARYKDCIKTMKEYFVSGNKI